MYKSIFIFFIIFLKSFSLVAQKIPDIQQNSVWIDGFVADGQLEEWKQPLQAYNNDTHIAYTLANDDTYLYLAVKSNRKSKILTGGVTLAITKPNNQEVKVIYPYDFTYDRRENVRKKLQHPDRPRKLIDLDKIETVGITGDADSIISLYNAYGIQVGVSEFIIESDIYEYGEEFCIVEMAIPLVHLGIIDKTHKAFDYQIVLRGILMTVIPGASLGTITGIIGREDVRQTELNARTQKNLDEIVETRLKGRYTLAERP